MVRRHGMLARLFGANNQEGLTSEKSSSAVASPSADRSSTGSSALAPASADRSSTKSSIFPSFLLGAQSMLQQPGKPVWMRRDYVKFADEAYRKNVVAHRAIDMIATAAASVSFKLNTAEAPHPLMRLIRRPNPLQGRAEFFNALYAYQLISGNAFIQAVGPKGDAPLELYALRPDRVQVIAGKAGMPKGYRYAVGDQVTDFPVDRLTGQSRILHLKQFHPLDDWYGLSAVEAAAYSIDQHNQAGAWNQALLQNGARPSGALVVNMKEQGGRLSEEQYARVKDQVDAQFSGPENAGRPLLLEGGLDWKEMSLSPKDMDFIDAKHSSARDIALAFGVPPQLLGIPGDNTYANLAEARLALWEQTVIPLLGQVTDALNGWLAPMFGNELRLTADLDNIPALSLRRDHLWERAKDADFLSDDEKRAMVGMKREVHDS